MEGDDHGQTRTTRFLRKEGFKPPDIHRRLSAVCEKKVPTRSSVINWVRTSIRGKETAQAPVPGTVTSRKSGFVESSGSSQEDGRDL